MKRVLSVVVALMILCAVTINAFALGFVPSIEVKTAPRVVSFFEDGKEIIGKIVDVNGNVLSIEEPWCIVVTPVAAVYEERNNAGALTVFNQIRSYAAWGLKAEAETQEDHEATEEVKSDLVNTYEDIKKNGTKVLNGLVDEGLVVRDMFAISSDCADLLRLLPIEGNKLDLKFDLNLGKEEKIQAVVRVNGTWKKLPIVNNGDGTVSATFEDLGVVAFLGKTTGESPDTGDHSGAELALWISLMAVSAIAIVVLLVVVHRKRTDK